MFLASRPNREPPLLREPLSDPSIGLSLDSSRVPPGPEKVAECRQCSVTLSSACELSDKTDRQPDNHKPGKGQRRTR